MGHLDSMFVTALCDCCLPVLQEMDPVDVVLTRRNGRFSGEAFAVLQMPMQVGGRHRDVLAQQLHILLGSFAHSHRWLTQ